MSDCLCFTANTAGSTIAMSVTGTPTLGQNFSYSIDGSTWSTFTPGTTTVTLSSAGNKVWFKGNNPNGVNESDSIRYKFVMTGSIAASGNIMSLIDNGAGTVLTIPNSYCYNSIFNGCSSLTTAPTLPATTLSPHCYESMFRWCSSLITPPVLPATALSEDCYYGMFANCTALTAAPSLPATTLANYCYRYMFQNCTSLTTVPALPAITLTNNYCYYYMFSGCTSLYVSDASGTGYNKAWTIPTSGTFTNTYSQSNMFTNCLGTRSSDDMAGASGSSYTYYTQNTPYAGKYVKLYSTPEYEPIEISTDAGMAEVLTAANIGKVYKFTGTTGAYTNGDLYIVTLPSGYTALEYIQAPDVSAYFDTGFIPKNTTRVTATISNFPKNNEGQIFGSKSNASNDVFEMMITGQSTYRTDFYNNAVTLECDEIDDRGQWVLDKSGNYTVVYRPDGTIACTATNTSGTFTGTYTMYIFTMNVGGSTLGTWTQGKLYNLKIYDDGTLVRDFIPAIRDSDSAVGLYDAVNNLFYENQGSTAFIAGPRR